MEVDLSPDQKAFIRQAIETGRFQHAGDAVREAMGLLEERERTRAEMLAAAPRISPWFELPQKVRRR